MDLGNINSRLLIILILFTLISGFFAFNGFLEWDEGSFLLNAEHFSGQEGNFEESRPAAISFIIAGIWTITGDSVLAARLAVMMFGIASILVFYRLAEREFDDPVLPTAFFGLAPLMLHWSARVYTDVPALLFILGSLYMYRKRNFLSAGILLSVAATFRYLFFIFALGMALAFVFDNRRGIINYIGGGFIGALPFMGYSLVEYGSPFSKVVMYVTRVTKWSSSGMFAATIPSIMSMISVLSTLLPATAYGWRDSPIVEKSMLLSYTLFMLLFSGNSFQRYWLASLPFVILIAYRGLDRNLFIAVSSLMILTSGIAVTANYNTHNECGEPLHQALDYAEGLEGSIVTDNWAIAGFELDRSVYSPWKSLQDLNAEENASFAVMSSEKDYKIVKSFENSCINYRIYNLSIPSN
ncbi:MAG: glycosyltransferase family 39 protein [Nanohaloarchaea archaeon]|nr:glycosyltransferase family 39 protein [Candidatus Nanohaloarchaea archaeon]